MTLSERIAKTRTHSPELRNVVEARTCLENARGSLLTLAQLDETNARALYQIHAEIGSLEAQLLRYEAMYRKAVTA